MGKMQHPEKNASPVPDGTKKLDNSHDQPPQIPPRMKKKGPALPEKPPHMRAQSSQPPFREPLRPRILNLDKSLGTQQREILVAASKAGREKPVEKRQREPAKLLTPTSGGAATKKDFPNSFDHFNDSVHKKELSVLPKGPIRLEDCIPAKKDLVSKNPLWSHDEKISIKKIDPKMSLSRKNRPLQPVLLVPRNLLTWGSAPISYALWTQRDVSKGGVGGIKSLKHNPLRPKSETSDTSAVRVRSGSVTRSGSLTSQGSSSSDSGGETFPKSVLKKQKRSSANNSGSSCKGSSSNRKVDQKKNVTFNAFATVQLMEE